LGDLRKKRLRDYAEVGRPSTAVVIGRGVVGASGENGVSGPAV